MFEPNDEFELIVLTNIGPENRSAIVIDNFYKNPDEVRELCLSYHQTTDKENPDLIAGLPGNKVYMETDEVSNKLKSIFLQLCSEMPFWRKKFDPEVFERGWREKNNAFVCNVVNDKTLLGHPRGIIPHQDYYPKQNPISEKTQFASVIFLNTPEECKGGTDLFSYKGKTSLLRSNTYSIYRTEGEDDLPRQEVFRRLRTSIDNSSDWRVEKHFPMRYNRCILYEADSLHSPILDIGMFTDYSRISQVLFM